MPLYEYQCETCEHRFEQIQRFSDPPVARCPQCRGAVRKLVSSPAIQFKGSGWYVTDYARQGKQDASETSDPPAAKADTQGPKSSDSKGSSDSSKTSAEAPKASAKPSKSERP
ncbi:MAG: FmdB family zinc ribbon protein [Acidobacteriota bacterium]|nr:FmdB family zinc ribbon protein [Acidobacteriota bacterium]